ncbi:MAG: pyruvate kinase, partial [Chlamydiia bacterium]|nr:pyruvate kinase [Chlamydiia bacterium]
MSRTKIICTIGPAVSSYEAITALIDAGMNVARLNLSHGTHEDHAKVITHLKNARQEKGVPLAIMLDTKGPEIRLGDLVETPIKIGDRWRLVSVREDDHTIALNPPHLLQHLIKGQEVLIDDGYLSATVEASSEEGVEIRFNNGGILKGRKSVCLPGVAVDLPALTEKDIVDIRFACQQDLDLIAASFIRRAEDIIAIKKILEEEHQPNILVIAKIENSEGVDNFDSILQVTDGVMIARGDLGVQMPLGEVPALQKMMIRKCYLAGKPVVTATQMLESMIRSPRPTRAETSDVANAIYDSSSAVMLSGETAVGDYPIQTVQVMKTIIRAAEADFDYEQFFYEHADLNYHDVPSSVSLAGVKTAYSSQARALFVFTTRGSSARLASRLRPSMPIIALTDREKTFHQLALIWGVYPILGESYNELRDAFEKMSAFAIEKKIVSYGDLVIVTAGSPFGISGTTNMMLVENIGEVLVRGEPGYGNKTYGKVVHILSP